MISASTSRRARRGMVREWRLHALSVFSLAVAFVCLGAALLVVTNLKLVEERWAHAGRASIYLKDGSTQDEIDALRVALARVPGVTVVHYLSSGEARMEFERAACHMHAEQLEPALRIVDSKACEQAHQQVVDAAGIVAEDWLANSDQLATTRAGAHGGGSAAGAQSGEQLVGFFDWG